MNHFKVGIFMRWSLRYKILGVVNSLADFEIILYMACYNVFRFVMKSGAKGCEIIVCGKLRAARAKSMNFKSFESFNQNLTVYLSLIVFSHNSS
ncbi:hypothetical protein YC2023_008284 [Brassica napus]|uniref:(rape) hypothetical protein n=1 Tax=Brassica napus TaxID=3708 RepID=A0A816R917_BRANA|nr:unnamed protein product [Brassica napus]